MLLPGLLVAQTRPRVAGVRIDRPHGDARAAALSASVRKPVEKLGAGGPTVLLTTQCLDEAAKWAGQIAILHRGRIVVNGRLDELKKLWPPAMVEYCEK